jgi:hypothetical protein
MDNPAWGDFGGYMREKKRKLDEQFEEDYGRVGDGYAGLLGLIIDLIARHFVS